MLLIERINKAIQDIVAEQVKDVLESMDVEVIEEDRDGTVVKEYSVDHQEIDIRSNSIIIKVEPPENAEEVRNQLTRASQAIQDALDNL